MHKGSEKMTSSNNSTLPSSNPIKTNIPNPIDDKDNPNVQPSDSYEVALNPVVVGTIVAAASLVVAAANFAYQIWYNHFRDTSIYRDMNPGDRQVMNIYEETAQKAFADINSLSAKMNSTKSQSEKVTYARQIIAQGDGLAALYETMADKIESSLFRVTPGSDTIKQLQERASFYREQAGKVRGAIQQLKDRGYASEPTLDGNNDQVALNGNNGNGNGGTAQPTNSDPAVTYINAYNNAPTNSIPESIAYAENTTRTTHPTVVQKDLNIMRETVEAMNNNRLKDQELELA
jgi:hypothetical protein